MLPRARSRPLRPARARAPALVVPLALAFALAFALAALVVPAARATDVGACEPTFGASACASESRASAQCGRDAVDVAAGRIGASFSGERYCDDDGTRGEFVHASASDGEGRTALRWERVEGPWGGYREVAVSRAPWIVDWYSDESGCSMRAAAPLVPASDHACELGSPMGPPRVPWGSFLP